jgi:hypothetical protein
MWQCAEALARAMDGLAGSHLDSTISGGISEIAAQLTASPLALCTYVLAAMGLALLATRYILGTAER